MLASRTPGHLMGRAKIVDRSKQHPRASEVCLACNLTLEYLRERAESFECSRVECPHRKPLTASPPQHLLNDGERTILV